MTDNMADTAKQSKSFHLCVTPEGTRSPNPDWKKGFYFIALKAEIPILLYGVDYERKLIQCTKTVIPSGNVEKDMRDIKLYFKNFKGKKPENFVIGEVNE
jgi:1-acyl-sn-glycerol-3-phosphate acyltransferase